MTTAPAAHDHRPSYLAAAIAGALLLVLYVVTLAPSTAMWDASEYIASAYILGLPHPPGNPLFVLIGRVFSLLPIAPTVAQRVNILAAVTSAGAAMMWFLVTERVLSGWLAQRWQRITGAALAVLIGGTAFTVWNQSVVNEKVYTVSLFGLAVISWLAVLWSDDPDGPAADRRLVLIAYLLGLGFANHMMGFLAAPAVAVAVLVRRPATLLRWKLLLVCALALLLGMTVFATQPIRAAMHPALNAGEPTTWSTFWYNFNRGQYGKPSLLDRQAPFLGGQVAMWWMYFRWQWLRDAAGGLSGLQQLVGVLFLGLGVAGGWEHWKRDRRSFWYFGPFMLTLTLLLVIYLNFKYGYSQGAPPGAASEVRDRDYFFIVGFSAWGVWAALGLVALWDAAGRLFGTEHMRVGRETVVRPTRRGWLLGTPVLALAIIPLVANWSAASRRGETATRDFAADLLNSVEPYGVLVTVGDNDTFPLWYAQEVEGIRRDVLVANTSLLNTDWYPKQLVRRPVYTYDAARGPAIYRGRAWPKPTGPLVSLTPAQLDSLPLYQQVTTPQLFQAGSIRAVVPPQLLERSDLFVLMMIRDAFPGRPIYFSRTSGGLAGELGLERYTLLQGLARKLLPAPATPGADTVLVPREGFVDAPRTIALWNDVFQAPRAITGQERWVDRASVGIPYLYIATGMLVADLQTARGAPAAARRTLATTERLAQATGLGELFAQIAAPVAPGLPLENQQSPLLDTDIESGGDSLARRSAPSGSGRP